MKLDARGDFGMAAGQSEARYDVKDVIPGRERRLERHRRHDVEAAEDRHPYPADRDQANDSYQAGMLEESRDGGRVRGHEGKGQRERQSRGRQVQDNECARREP